MNLDKYNIVFNNQDIKHNKSQKKYYKKKYLKFLYSLSEDSSVLEVWPWNLSFLFNYVLPIVKKENIFISDISKWVIENIKQLSLLEEKNLLFWDFLNIDKKFDLIVFRHVFEHFDKEYTEKVVANLSWLLNENGTILIEVPNWFNLFYWITNFSLDFTHLQVWSEKTIKQVFDFYFKDEYELSFFWLNVFPYKIWFLSILWYSIRLFISFISFLICKIYVWWTIWDDFLLCKITKKWQK